MLVSCAVAFTIPFELVLISYAFLGPAHYLTEISWLHDRNYFVEQKSIFLPMAILSLAVTAFMFIGVTNVSWSYAVFALAVATAFSFLLGKNLKHKIYIFAGISILFGLLGVAHPPFAMGLAFLLPTVIHVYFFTGIFIALGALKAKSFWGYVSLAVFVFCGLIFFFVTPATTTLFPEFLAQNVGFFNGLTDYISTIISFEGRVTTHSLFAFLSFAYTYHYLNWFSKVEIIKWHKLPKNRLFIIVCIYVLAISLYLYNYKAGFMALTLLSIAHVMLELPLNIISIKGLFLSAFKGKAVAA